MSDISKQITENALRGNLVELSQRKEQTHLQIQTLNEMVGRLRKENAKLRECLQDFADAIKNDDGFGVDQGWMLERMRELGIEVK